MAENLKIPLFPELGRAINNTLKINFYTYDGGIP